MISAAMTISPTLDILTHGSTGMFVVNYPCGIPRHNKMFVGIIIVVSILLFHNNYKMSQKSFNTHADCALQTTK